MPGHLRVPVGITARAWSPMVMNRRQFLMTAASTALACQAPAAERSFQSTPERVAVLELFTSEGCSSCPPAEVWFTGLREAPGLWAKFIPVAFHVDYWDYLGWKDGFASPEFTKRQNHHAARWGSGRIYTPEFVLNGEEWRAGHLDLPRAETVGILALKQTGEGSWSIHFEPARAGSEVLLYHLALLGSASSKVTAGENSGHTLQHDFTVLNHVSLGSGGWL
jgi:hypothetical protein